MNYKKYCIDTIVLVLSTMAFLWPAFLNGFPLVFSDTGTYLSAAIEGFLPVDRPVHYSYLIYFFNEISKFWLIIFFQSLIVSYVLFITYKILFKELNSICFLVIAFFLSLFTSLPWFASQIMPDIFSAIVIFAGGLLLVKKIELSYRIGLIFILIIVAPTHVSNFVIWGGMIIISLLHYQLVYKKIMSNINMHKDTLCAFILAIIILLAPHLIVNQKVAVSSASNVMLLGKLLDQGIALRYLDQYCQVDNLPICNQLTAIHSLKEKSEIENLPIGFVSDQFLWGGIMSELGGLNQVSTYASFINKQAIKNEPILFILKILNGFGNQIVHYKIGDTLMSFSNGSSFYENLKLYFPDYVNEYKKSIQYKGWGDLLIINKIYKWILIISLLVIFCFYWLSKSTGLKIWSSFILVGVINNSLVTGGLSAVHDRYGSRVAWIFVLIALFFVLDFIRQSKNNKNSFIIQNNLVHA